MNNEEINVDNNINFFLTLKASLIRENDTLFMLKNEMETTRYLIEDNYTDNIINTDSNLLCIEIDNKILLNNTNINNIINKLNAICNHMDVESDEIETGIETSMMKIKYCTKCFLNM